MELSNYIMIYLRPGEFYASSEPVVIKTVLGSCVAVCLHDKINKIGGANHYLLPYQKDKNENLFSYGEKAIPELVDTIIRQGGNKSNLVAQLVGGSCSHRGGILDVGQSNIAIARKLLQEYGIPIVHEDVGGSVGRVVRFYPKTNELFTRPAGGEERDSSPSSRKTAAECPVQLSETQLLFLNDSFGAGVQRAQQSLTTMMGMPVEMSISEILLRKMEYVQAYSDRKFSELSEIFISTGQKEQVPLGEVAVLVEPAPIAMIVNVLFGRPTTTTLTYGRMESSAIVELANIVINAILGTLANMLGFPMMLRVPKFVKTREELAAVPFMNKSRHWKLCLAVKSSLKAAALGMDTPMLLMVELNSPYMFFQKLKV